MFVMFLLILIGVSHGAVIPAPNIIANTPEENLGGNTLPVKNGSDNGLQLPPRNPFRWSIHGSPLTLWFSSYGKEVNEDDIISCDIAAKNYIHDVVWAHGDGPIPPSLQLHWSHESAILSIQHSTRMTYGILADVLTGIETFQLTYDYFEVHFEIIDKAKGIVGSGDIRSIGSIQANSSTTPMLPIEDISPTLILPPAAKQLPDPPYSWPPDESAHVKLTFTAYGPGLEEQDVLNCYVAAANYVLQMIKAHSNIRIAQDLFLHWTHGTAALTVQHMPRMRFGDLADVLAALGSFQSQYGYTEAAFHFSDDQHGILGAGSVESRDKVWNNTTSGSSWILSIPANATTLPTFPTTMPTDPTNLALPPDPTTVHLPDSSLSLTFTHYGRALPSEDLLHAWLLLTQRVTTQLLDGKRDAPMLEALIVKSRHALMVVSPKMEMAWGKLAVALEGITGLLSRWGWLSCNFAVGEDGVGMIGDGFVMFV
ncbi:MAG: hypothetical protein Q9210_003877 [Variospora velana]